MHRLRYFRSILEKGNLPWQRLPTFVVDSTVSFLRHWVGGRPNRFGARLPGLAQQVKSYGILVACAIQWREAVMQGVTTGRKLSKDSYLEIKYEELIERPETYIKDIADFLSLSSDSPILEYLRTSGSKGRVGRWHDLLKQEDLDQLEPHMRPTIEFLGYSW